MLEVKGLRKVYYSHQRPVEALKGVSFKIARGQVFGLLGPNGSGKTTTIKIVCGLIEPDAGKIYIDGLELRRNRAHCLAKLGAVLEGSRNVHWRLTPWENLMLFGARRELPRQLRQARAQRLLTFFGLEEKRDEIVGNLSRGMQQKVALACALIGDPELLLLDEPTLGLDVHSAELLKQRIQQLAHEEGKAILLTTHQMELAEELCDRVAIIDEGRLLLCEAVSALKEAFRQHFYVIRVYKTQPVALWGQITVPVQEHDSYWELRAQSDSEFFQLVRLLEEYQLKIASVNTESPDLKEIFLQVVKKP
jgi:ABC-2 type transport system ATP-binding protein